MSPAALTKRVAKLTRAIRAKLTAQPSALMSGSLLLFALFFLRHLLTDPCGYYHRELCAQLDLACQAGRRLLGVLPREHAKTTLGTVALVLREVCLGRKSNILLIAANREEAQAKLRLIIEELEHNALLKQAFGSKLAPARDLKGHRVAYADSEIVLAGGARISTLGFGGKVRGQLAGGRRLDLVVLDDPENDQSVLSAEQRRQLRHWVDHALLNALDVRQGSLIWLGTLLHHDCVLAQWLKHQRGVPQWQIYQRRALKLNGRPLWPERFSPTLLDKRRREIGERAFSQEYMNQPVSLEGCIFTAGGFRRYDPGTLCYRDGEWSLNYRPLTVVVGVDPAIGESDRHDYFAAVVLGLAVDEPAEPSGADTGVARLRIYVLDVVRTRQRFAAQLDLLNSIARRWLPRVIGIESIAYQAALAQQALAQGLPVRELAGTRPKPVRIEAAAVHVAEGRVWLPVSASWVADFVEEAEAYPAGRHDDQLDALARALEAGLPLIGAAGGLSTGAAKRDVLRGLHFTGRDRALNYF